jgi:hypothetical protein
MFLLSDDYCVINSFDPPCMNIVGLLVFCPQTTAEIHFLVATNIPTGGLL